MRLALALLLLAMPAAARAEVVREPYGTTAGGEAVERITLANARGHSVSLLTLGGIITAITMPDREGRLDNVVLGLPDLAAYEARANFGSIVGRYAGRISGGGFVLDGRRVALADDPAATVSHGGRNSLGAQVWQAEQCTTAGCSSVKLRHTSPAGANRFPGRLSVEVDFTLTDDDALQIEYTATSDAPTVLNLTHHAYFNLAGGGSADGQSLQLFADRIAELGPGRIPTGRMLPVDGTPFDFRQAAPIGTRLRDPHPQMRLTRGLDHWFALGAVDGTIRLATRATDPASGRVLEVLTSEPGMQVYTANSFDGTLAGAGGRMLRQGDGYAIETQHAPDSPNQPDFPSTVLRPGQTFRSTTIFRFTAE
ncbi:aldose epimerase family protein [Croceibacterium ferulae]|uniref:aldose epimerase family protein n=1 Tax=Croceibacterium ferulae TaxID=1854641 RepID=UPI001F4ED264|nr:aldose epimerase family protein [Croceibacterium ferulae]